jgi:DNA-directed RNA polymerase subunit beta
MPTGGKVYMATLNKPLGLPLRYRFGVVSEALDIPDLIRVQKESYERFLQKDVPPEKREEVGIEAVFRSIFPIPNFAKTAELRYKRYWLDAPKYEVEECRERGITYAAPMKITVQLVTWDIDPETGERTVRDVKEQEVYFGDIPLMTENGTFVINGAERVVVSQLHRSPGVFFESDKGRTTSTGKLLYFARIIPNRGSWVDFEFDHKDILWVRIDKRRKMLATTFLKALGYDTQQLLELFYPISEIMITKDGKFFEPLNIKIFEGQRSPVDIKNPTTGEVLVKKGDKLSAYRLKKLQSAGITEIELKWEDIKGRVLADDIVDENTGEVLIECNKEIDDKTLQSLVDMAPIKVKVLLIDNINAGPYLRNTLLLDKTESQEEAAVEVYRKQRPGDPASPEQAMAYFNSLFFASARYDLSPVGRMKMNFKLGQNVRLEQTTLLPEDFIAIVKYLLDLKMGKPHTRVDDIDQLSNRRVRAVGELMENRYREGMVKMQRAVREKMTLQQDMATLMPHDFINAKPVSAVVREYFGSGQLSQFMDQTNPLSEITNKRRLSALGPGGLTRDRAGFEVRDVHATHYGRICPIETPEGPNIGLISSLATHARVNEFGFIETPYRRVKDRKVMLDEIVYLTAMEEENQTIAQATAQIDENGYLIGDLVQARRNEDYIMVRPEEVTLIDVSPSQIVSVAAALIPFLEHDDANRALMGSNMMRQAVPLLKPESPLVGTGLEWVAGRDSGSLVIARRSGIVESATADRIVIRPDGDQNDPEAIKPDIYQLVKYRRSNQNTCLSQRPLVRRGDRVKAGQIIADGSSTAMGELALGQNVIVAFTPWGGYNFEDSILLSERLVQDDRFTSIHIEEFECVARDTKLGKEEITRDIPNVNEESLKDLDADGIVRIGAEVRPGDILVGKITPKGETQLSPEERLLRAIFGEKAADVKDSSLRVPPGITGIVIGAKVFARRGVEKDDRTKDMLETESYRLQAERDEEISLTKDVTKEKLIRLLAGKKAAASVVGENGACLVRKNATLTEKVLQMMDIETLSRIRVVDGEEVESRVQDIVDRMNEQIEAVKVLYKSRLEKLRRGDDLPPGVLKTVKVYVAIKRKIQVGDKMAGRHGNKGVVSRILPIEDMPYLEDGTPVDIVLNPLGVPSRMNVGQILETHLGWAAYHLGKQIDEMVHKSVSEARETLKRLFKNPETQQILDEMDDDEIKEVLKPLKKGLLVASPVFDGAKEEEIKEWLRVAGLPESGKTILFDGRTGEPFDSEVTVGVMYMMKLHHLVDEKIHARATGPYSLVTQQPLGGKAQFGGQRLGEMEVWAMEAYGAAHALQEFLTVKSDDVLGRTATYDSIVKGDCRARPGLPESFNVLVKELKALAINVDLIEAKDEVA